TRRQGRAEVLGGQVRERVVMGMRIGAATSMTAVALLTVFAEFAPASAAIAGKLPGPDIPGLLPLAAMPIEKPPIAAPGVALPSPPKDWPELPSPPFLTDRDQRPKALMPPPRTLACNPIGSVFRVASELLECARARYQRGELEEARETFQRA